VRVPVSRPRRALRNSERLARLSAALDSHQKLPLGDRVSYARANIDHSARGKRDHRNVTRDVRLSVPVTFNSGAASYFPAFAIGNRSGMIHLRTFTSCSCSTTAGVVPPI